MSKVEERGKRRSARILALEEKARALFLQKAESKTASDSGDVSCNASSSKAAAPTKNRKRGRKRKSLHDVHLGGSAFPQEQEMPEYDDMSIKHGGLFVEANLSSNQLMPSKGALEFILDVIQRRDIQELFAEPVDPTKVDGYYDVVKEPMDFGTMRAKLQEEIYTSLEQFERDVFLVFSNAMRFNVPNSLYYEVAEDLSTLGQRLFHSLRTEPRNFDYIYTRARQQLSNKTQGEAGGPHAKLVKRGGARGSVSLNDSSNMTDQRYLAPWHPKRYINRSTSNVAAGSTEGSSFLSPETERRNTYISQISFLNKKPIVSAVYNSPKMLTNASDAGMRYTESLNKFVEILGPKVKAVADKKLRKQPVETLSCISWNPAFSCQPTNLPEPAAAYSFSGRAATGKPAHGRQISSSLTANTSVSSKGKMVCMDGSKMSSHSILGQTHHPLSGYGSDSSATDNLAFRYSSCGGDSFSNRNLDVSDTSEENTAKIGNMDLLLATIMQVSAIQSRNSRCPSGSYFPLTGNRPPPSGSLFPFWGNGGPLGFQPSQMSWPPTSSSSKPVVISSCGAGNSQFMTFLCGVEPRYHQSGEWPGNAGGAYFLDQRLKGKSVYPVDFGQLKSWTTQGAASQRPDRKWVDVPPLGDHLKPAASSREKQLFHATSRFDGGIGGSGQQAKPRWMTYEAGCLSSVGAGAAPPSFKTGHQQPDLSLQL